MSAAPSWQELHFTAKKEQVAALESWLFECGALSVTLEDDADQPLLEPGPGETPLWEAVSVTALFEGDRALQSVIDAVPRHLVVTIAEQPIACGRSRVDPCLGRSISPDANGAASLGLP